MKKIILFASMAVVAAGVCEEITMGNFPTQQLVVKTLMEDGSTNLWTEADLQDALGLMNRAYHRDMKTAEGRRRWHGDARYQYLTNHAERTVQRIEIYADGFTNVVKGTKRKLRTPEEEAAWMLERKQRREQFRVSRIDLLRAKIAELEAVLATSTNDLERARATIDLYQARRNLQRAEAAQTNTVTVIVTP